MRNYTQDSVMTYMGKESKKKNSYTYKWFTLLYNRNQHNIVKQLYSNKNLK